MIAEEFIYEITNNNLAEIDILNYAKEYFSIGGELDSLIMKMMANISTNSQIVFTGDRGNDGIEEIKVIERISIEKEKQNDRLFKAMGIVEVYKEKMEEKIEMKDFEFVYNLVNANEYLTSEEEKERYTSALLGALNWGYKIDHENEVREAQKNKNILVKVY
jgi:hypothetical protein